MTTTGTGGSGGSAGSAESRVARAGAAAGGVDAARGSGGADAASTAGGSGSARASGAAGVSGAEETGPVVIRTRGLTKRYRGGQLAVDGLDLTVPGGSVFGFLGPNGSGKTTTIRMLMGLIDPTSGTAEVLGRPMPGAARTVLRRSAR